MRSKVVRMMLLCFAGEHLQGVLLLGHQFYCSEGRVLLVPVESKESMIQWEVKWLE